MPAVCIVLAPGSDLYLVRLLKLFRRENCLAEHARKVNVYGTYESNGNTMVSHLTQQQQDTLRSKTHSHYQRPNKCRIPHWPPHCSRLLERFPSVKLNLISGAAIILINVRCRRPRGFSDGFLVHCAFTQFRGAMEYLQTIINVLHSIEQRSKTKNISCCYFLEPQRDFDEDWWLSLARITKQETCWKHTFSFCFEPQFRYVQFPVYDTGFLCELHDLLSLLTRKMFQQCWSIHLTRAILRFICVGWLDMMMWHAYDRRYLVGDRVIYEHKQRESLYRVEYRFVPAVVSKRTPSLLTLTLDDGHTMHGQSQLTLHNDLTTWKPIRRCFFGGDVVNVCRHNAAVLGVVRQDVKIYLLDGGNPAVRVQLLHENGYVYPSVDEMQFCFKLCTGCCIPDTNSTIHNGAYVSGYIHDLEPNYISLPNF